MAEPSTPSAITPPSLGLSSDELRVVVERALAEDVGGGDITTRLVVAEGQRAQGEFISKQSMVVAGLPVVAVVFRSLDSAAEFQPLVEEGSRIGAKTALARVAGAATTLLTGERVALNFLQHLCGIATLTWNFKARLAGLKTELLDTRKSTPGLRALQKYAVRMGGGRNHRLRLDDGILIKNNHLSLAGGIHAAVERARQDRDQSAISMPIEVEVRSLSELEEAMRSGADMVLLDNMSPGEVRKCVALAAGRVRLEVSGGVDLENIRAYAETGVDCISVGALTHSAPAADIHFLIRPA